MRDSIPSCTAIATVFLRALHVRLDDLPPVLDDLIAYELLPAYLRRYIILGAASIASRSVSRRLPSM